MSRISVALYRIRPYSYSSSLLFLLRRASTLVTQIVTHFHCTHHPNAQFTPVTHTNAFNIHGALAGNKIGNQIGPFANLSLHRSLVLNK